MSYERNALGLTPTQNRILTYITQGLCNKLICRESGLAEGTVKVHVGAILRELGVRDRTAAVVEVSRRAGLDLASWVKGQP